MISFRILAAAAYESERVTSASNAASVSGAWPAETPLLSCAKLGAGFATMTNLANPNRYRRGLIAPNLPFASGNDK